MPREARILVFATALALALPVVAAECPPAIEGAALKAHANAKVTDCKEEKEEGKVQYEVRLLTKEGEKMELDVSPDGKILLTEEYVALDKVPAAVTKSLKAKHADANATAAEMRTSADGKVTYEIAFESGKEKKQATFTAAGKLVEEEEEEGDED